MPGMWGEGSYSVPAGWTERSFCPILMVMISLFLLSYSVPSLLSLGHTLMESLGRQCLGHRELMTVQGKVATELRPWASLSLGVSNPLSNAGLCAGAACSCPEETYKWAQETQNVSIKNADSRARLPVFKSRSARNLGKPPTFLSLSSSSIHKDHNSLNSTECCED